MSQLSKHTARKRFGQNFLTDDNIIQKIVACANFQDDDIIVEIGPGKGALTHHFVHRDNPIHLIEIDRDLSTALQEQFHSKSHIQISNQDVLTLNFSDLAHDHRLLNILGNLPYNISTPLLFHCLDHTSIIRQMTFMLQKEVVDRITAQPNTKAYGKLSVLFQYHCHAEKQFDIPPSAFQPQPKVMSSVVTLTPKGKPSPEAKQPETLKKLVHLAFSQRRKTLKNNLKSFVSSDAFELANIDASRRAESLTLSEFVQLANSINHIEPNP